MCEDKEEPTFAEVEQLARKVVAGLDVKLARVKYWIEYNAERHSPESLTQQAPELLKAIDHTRSLLSFVQVTPKSTP